MQQVQHCLTFQDAGDELGKWSLRPAGVQRGWQTSSLHWTRVEVCLPKAGPRFGGILVPLSPPQLLSVPQDLGAAAGSKRPTCVIMIKPHEEYQETYDECLEEVEALPLPL